MTKFKGWSHPDIMHYHYQKKWEKCIEVDEHGWGEIWLLKKSHLITVFNRTTGQFYTYQENLEKVLKGKL